MIRWFLCFFADHCFGCPKWRPWAPMHAVKWFNTAHCPYCQMWRGRPFSIQTHCLSHTSATFVINENHINVLGFRVWRNTKVWINLPSHCLVTTALRQYSWIPISVKCIMWLNFCLHSRYVYRLLVCNFRAIMLATWKIRKRSIDSSKTNIVLWCWPWIPFDHRSLHAI